MDKPWYKSKTAWGSILVGGGMILSGAGRILLNEGDLAVNFTLMTSGVGVVLTAMGLRTAIN